MPKFHNPSKLLRLLHGTPFARQYGVATASFHTYAAINKPRTKTLLDPIESLTPHQVLPLLLLLQPLLSLVSLQGPQLSNLLLELSKTSGVLHTGSDVKGYSRPLTSVVSKEVGDIFDDGKLFHAVLEKAERREIKTIDLSKKVADVIQPANELVHKVGDSVTLFTSNDQVKKRVPRRPSWVVKLNNSKTNDGLKVDLDSVLSFLDKNVR